MWFILYIYDKKMKDKSFVIKVSDLIQEWGRKDTVHFEHKFTEQIPNTSKVWISGDIELRSINKDSIYANLEHVNCVLEETCDNCENNFEREVLVDHYTARFVAGEKNQKEEQETSDEEVFLIDTKNETIDIQDMLVQSILLENPIINRCPDCNKKIINLPDEDDEEYFESHWNVVIHKK